MKYLLGTNICIYLIKQKPADVLSRFEAEQVGDVAVSSITVAELQFGVQKSRFVRQDQQALDQFLIPLVIAPFDYQATMIYGKIRADLEREGTPIGALDTLIAAHALSLEVTLVTNNTKEFERVPALRLANWVEG